jgi:WD40 repeat protein
MISSQWCVYCLQSESCAENINPINLGYGFAGTCGKCESRSLLWRWTILCQWRGWSKLQDIQHRQWAGVAFIPVTRKTSAWNIIVYNLFTNRPKDNLKFASCSADRSVFLWDIKTGLTIQRFQDHTMRVNSCSFNEEGNVICSGSYDSEVKVFGWFTRWYWIHEFLHPQVEIHIYNSQV